MCGLSLAWVTSENSTSNSNADILCQSSSPWLDPLFSATVSRVRCWLPLSVVPHQLCLLSRLSAVQLPTALIRVPSSTACQLLCPANSHSRPLTTSGYGEISGPRILCLVLRQNRQRNRLLWQATHIVLHKHLHLTYICCTQVFAKPQLWCFAEAEYPKFCCQILLKHNNPKIC